VTTARFMQRKPALRRRLPMGQSTLELALPLPLLVLILLVAIDGAGRLFLASK
jgi:hypothetical protein